MDPISEITHYLKRSNDGDQHAHERVMELIYTELHRIAKRHVGNQHNTLRPTALVNEAYLKLFRGNHTFEDREKLLSYAAIAMRQVVLNYAEKGQAKKRGGDQIRVTLQEWDNAVGIETDFVALNQVLEQLEKVHPRHARILSLCYFAGFKNLEIADLLEVSEATVYKDLRFAKAWVKKKLKTLSQADQRSK